MNPTKEQDLVRKMTPQFMDLIDPSLCMIYFDVHILLPFETSLINAKQEQKGRHLAAKELLDILSRKEKWFEKITETLRIEDLKLSHVADIFLQIKRQVDEDWNSLLPEKPHSVSDINQTTVKEFKFGKMKKDYATDVGRPGMPGARSADKSDKAQSCSQVAEELEGARANETAILKEVEQNEKNKTETVYTEDSGKTTKRVTHEENEPTSRVCGSSYNHCEQQKLNVLEEKIIAFLKTKTEPQPTLTIAKACCCETPKDVNPSLYRLAKKNIIKQCYTRSPTWQMM